MEPPSGLQPIGEAICLDHIVEPFLKNLATAHVNEYFCTFCTRSPHADKAPFAVSMDFVADRVFEAITSRYRSFDDASYYEGEAFETALDTAEVVYTVAEGSFDEALSEQVLGTITAAIVAPEFWFEEDRSDNLTLSWDQFAETVRRESRFVLMSRPRPGGDNEPPARVARFLEGLLAYADKSAQMLDVLPVGTRIYRGRMTDDPEQLRSDVEKAPAQQLGAAPASRAASGRMSGEGVPLFYAATNVRTAVAEIALHSPYDHALIGEFITQRPLVILDFTRKPNLPSIYDSARQARRIFVEFVDEFVDAITRPIILDGRERVDYLPTQVVTEFLRWVPARRIDGIAFPSRADKRGKNIVLFTTGGEDVVDDPPLPRKNADDLYATKVLWPGKNDVKRREPMLTLPRSGITEHSVTRHVTVHSR